MGQSTAHRATPDQALLYQLRTAIARIERPVATHDALPFGLALVDAALGHAGLAAGLHEVTDGAHGAAAGLFAAGIVARRPGPVLWVLEQDDAFAPGLAGAGLHPDRVIYAYAKGSTLLVMEEGLRHGGLAGVVAELSGRLSMTASRRVQLAAESTGTIGIALRRPRVAAPASTTAEVTAALTRWRVTALPSAAPIPDAPDIPGVGRGRWQLDLQRSRGGRTGSWVVEACDATGHLNMVSALGDRSAAQCPERHTEQHAA